MEYNRRTMYLRNLSGHPIGCLAIVMDRTNGTRSYQMSVLNPSDRFSRPLARQLAIGRLVEKPYSFSIKKSASMHDISRLVMTHVAGNKATPARAKKAAKLWLDWTNMQDEIQR